MAGTDLPLGPLRAFEAAARLGGFSAAARELGVTHSAVSQHMAALEARLGVTLFERSNRGVTLTEAGETLLPVLGEAFDRIRAALAAFSAPLSARKLRITATPVFASFWLIPRLGRLSSVLDGADIALMPTLDFVDIATGEADLGIRCGVPPWSGLDAELLLPITMSPVCAPRLLGAGHALDTPADALGVPLLHADAGGHARGEEWRMWFASAGVAPPEALPGQAFRDPGLAFQAAIAGLGLAMGYTELLRPALATGRLVRPFAHEVSHPFSYYLVTPANRSVDPAIAALSSRLRSETADSRR